MTRARAQTRPRTDTVPDDPLPPDRIVPMVIGIGNRDRGDDAVGPAVTDGVGRLCGDRATVFIAEGDLSDLVVRWSADQDVVVVDAMVSGRSPGSVLQIDALASSIPTDNGLLSSHGIGLAETVELARLLDRLPRSLTLWAIETVSFEQFDPMTPAVADAVEPLVERLVDWIRDST